MSRVKHAFTLVELLVVIAIIGVLVALFLPAVQAAREAARRTQCKNNMRQIGLALHNHHDVFLRLPAGWLADAPEGAPGWGWALEALPFMEQTNLWEQTRRDLPIGDPANVNTRRTVLAGFLCPSDPRNKLFMLTDESDAPIFEVPRGNYSGVFGTLEIEDVPSDGDGMFYHNSPTRLADVLDGLSNTLMVGERSSKHGGVTWVGVVPGAAEAMARVVGSTDHTPNHKAGHFDDFGSYHATGAHFALADGSVRIINDQIALHVYQALATRIGGEAAGE